MQGRRLPDGKGPDGRNPSMSEGDYWKDENGEWMARPPGMHIGSLKNHTIVEHEDGTITVSPSILHHEPPGPGWHGYLERGVWRTC